ncbi:HD domain-containing phosphohydrolase [Vibrio methylphosphonaticus]|uniref:HD domain-containing phosphohydrolase n=1 Tax=Vibrio methylphosphonaticus TaxID=2946866 RepID=UPI00202A979F|nr:HD domain-containing phosphohydrolase [Vibrio methylphosphonaticus]MCL9775348.1 GAF domain-containing protein [Vibrio methylphosphonaticus]
MPNVTKKKNTFALPLHVHMTAMFVILVVLVCGVQIWITQSSLNKVLLTANENLFDRIASETRSNMSFHFGPAFSIVDAYSSGELIREVDPKQRFSFVPELVSLLQTHRHIFAFKAGFPDGEWLAVARVQDQRIRKKIGLQPSAEYAAFSYNVVSHELTVKTYNQQLVLLKTKIIKDLTVDLLEANWFRSAILTKAKVSKPYYMPLLGRTGITLHRKAANGAVFGADILLDEVSSVLQDDGESRDALRVMYDDDFNVYANSQPAVFEIRDVLRQSTPLKLMDINHPLIATTANFVEFGQQAKEITYRGEKWVLKIDRLKGTRDQMFNLAMAVKSEQLLQDANAVAQRSIFGSFAALLLALPCIYYMSQWLARPIRQATRKAKSIQNFNFNDGSQEYSRVTEIKQMSDALRSVQSTIQRFLSLTNSMAKEDDLERLLALVCRETGQATKANSTYIYLLNDEETRLEPRFVSLKSRGDLDVEEMVSLQLDDPTLQHDLQAFFQLKQPVCIPHDEILPFLIREKSTDSVLFVPLIDRRQKVIGALGLGFDSKQENIVLMENIQYIETLAAYASVTIETQTMLNSQRALLESFIQVMAQAIDTKSPYTGTHCQRVPVLTEMLTAAAQEQSVGPFESFSMTTPQWEELHIAAWLHDCGKVTTPEHVIDKSTKLETIYNRIHEIRMRFEVVKRDAELEFYRKKLDLMSNAEERLALEKTCREIDQDFATIANVNIGDEYLSSDALADITTIAKRYSWTPTIDARLGLSKEELSRYDALECQVDEQQSVLSDGAHHLVQWEREPDRESRFVLKPGTHQNNLGELYNLSVRKGTLNKEERYIINSHMTATLTMLERLPFPKHMQNVPLLAGSHHEKMDGSGYPLGLMAGDLPLPARAMAIADVFEALTSQERPYKQPKKLSETLAIMKLMVRDDHLDAELFELFLTSEVYLEYARHHLLLEQIDVTDITPYLPAKNR